MCSWLLGSGRQAEPRLVRGLVGVKAWTVQCGHQHSGEDYTAAGVKVSAICTFIASTSL